jgi:hypothetical protein
VLFAALFSVARCHALTYAEWIATFPSLTGGATAEGADPDGDGLANLVEFALADMDPTVPATNPSVPMLQTRDGTGNYATPVLSLTTGQVAAAASVHLVLRYKARAGVTGIRYVPETNQGDLNHWGWGDSATTSWVDGIYTYARSHSDAKLWGMRAFMRLRVEVLP